jgi:RimJ/RimL family protein N-acetyltransferase
MAMTSDPLTVIDIDEQNLAGASDFLERYAETSLFLLSNIRAFGPRLGESLYSANLKGLRCGNEWRAVFCVTRGGTVLAQTAGETAPAAQILESCKAEAIPIRGVVGEWQITKTIWDLLVAIGELRPGFVSREISYRLDLRSAAPPPVSSAARMLNADDHAQWAELEVAYLRETGLPEQGTREQHKAAFLRSTRLGHWWGVFEGECLVSLAAIIAQHRSLGQVGGVYTVPSRRGEGLGLAVMGALVRDSRDTHHLEQLFLFTGEENVAARRLYESLGFERFGYFGLFFGATAKGPTVD